MPCERRSVADGVGQNDCARRGVSGVAESSDGLQVEQAGRLEIKPKIRVEHRAELSKGQARPLQSASPSGAHRRQATRRRRGCSAGGGDAGAGAGAGPLSGIQSTIVSSGVQTLPYCGCW